MRSPCDDATLNGEVNDISSELSALVERLGADPQRFEWLNSRSRELDKAKLKYGTHVYLVNSREKNK